MSSIQDRINFFQQKSNNNGQQNQNPPHTKSSTPNMERAQPQIRKQTTQSSPPPIAQKPSQRTTGNFKVNYIEAEDFSKRDITLRLKSADAIVSNVLSILRPGIPIVFVMGPTGSGKSTFINALLGVEQYCTKHIAFGCHIGPKKDVQHYTRVGAGNNSITAIPVLIDDRDNDIFYCDCPGYIDSVEQKQK